MTDADRRVTLPTGERQYHIDLAPGELAEYILLPGDPDRTDRIATMLEDIEVHRRHREFNSVTGTYQGQRVSVVATGHRHGQRGDRDRGDPGHHEAAHVHPHRLVRRAPRRTSRWATWSSPQARSGWRRPRSTSSTRRTRRSPTTRWSRRSWRPPRRPGTRAHVGITATAPGFYGAQGRPIPQLPDPLPGPRRRDGRASASSTSRWRHRRCSCWRASRAAARASSAPPMLSAPTGRFLEGEARPRAELACIETGLEALRDPGRHGRAAACGGCRCTGDPPCGPRDGTLAGRHSGIGGRCSGPRHQIARGGAVTDRGGGSDG